MSLGDVGGSNPLGLVFRAWRLATILPTLLVACSTSAFSLDPSLDISQYAHTAWKIRDGFFNGKINSIAQTPDGYLWVGTQLGLLRFDGVRAVPWRPPSDRQLPSNLVVALLAARDRTLWIGTSKGLASWKAGELTVYPQLAGLLVGTLLEDHEGTVWAGGFAYTPPGKLCAIHNGNVQCYGEDGKFGNGILGLYEDGHGNLWTGVLNGFWRWKPGPPHFYALSGEPYGIQGFAEDQDGSLLISIAGRVARLRNGKIETAYRYPGIARQNSGERILRDRDGALWMGTWSQGVVHVREGNTDTFGQRDGLSGDLVTALFEDREGNIWVGTTEGLDRFRAYSVATFSERQGLSGSGTASVLAARDGSIWFSPHGRLYRFDKGQVTVYHEPGGGIEAVAEEAKKRVQQISVVGLPEREVGSLFQDNIGRIWVVATGGVGYLENDRFTPVNSVPGGVVYAMAGDAKGSLWISMMDLGLFHLFRGKLVQHIPWAVLGRNDPATALAVDPSRGGVWLGFSKGGLAWLAEGRIRPSFVADPAFDQGRVSDLRFDRDGVLWVSSDRGISRIKDGRVSTLTTKNGLPCNQIYWLTKGEDHSFWLYGSCGLIRIQRSDLEAWLATSESADPKSVRATLFDETDGVTPLGDIGVGPLSQAAAPADGKIWFVAIDGLSVIDLRHVPFNAIPPPVHIEQVIADDKTYDVSAGTRLPSQSRDITIDYTALSLVVPEKVRFRVKLEGQDKNWKELVNERRVRYTNLPPRHYRFRVIAANNSGVWNESGDSLEFDIPPAWYQTIGFRVICIAAFMALLWAAYQLRVHQLQDQEETFRETIESIPAMAFVSLPDGYRTFVNKGWVEYTGLTVEQSSGSGWHTVIHPEDLNRVLGEWEAALAGGNPMCYEARYRRADDHQYRWFMVRVMPQRNKRGKILKWFGTLTDIEDRKRAEEALRSSEAYLTEAQSLTQTGSCAIDGASRETVYWSDEMFRLFGFDPQQGLPMFDQWLRRVYPQDREKVRLVSERAFVDKAGCEVEFRIVNPDGTIKHIHGIGHPVLSSTGDLVQVLGTMVDVTERKRAEEAREKLRQLEADLAHTNRVTTMGELVASISHELAQPITVTTNHAKASLRWLQRDPPELAEVRKGTEKIVEAGTLAAGIIDRLRSLYTKAPPKRELVAINEVISDMAGMLKSEASCHGVSIHTDLMDTLPMTAADRVQLHQVLMNLILNGIEAMSETGGVIVVKSELSNESQILISVIDTGPGLPDGKSDQLFEAFFTTKPQGSGMGLAICKSIVESHGGRIWASESLRRGATFHFTLPTAPAT